ncbi:MAG: hypothetical protein P9L99_20435 [Candidatus Lernaella stagnicola]|nr:hypothetical protein [Candidatus Lernaella stagnicola]
MRRKSWITLLLVSVLALATGAFFACEDKEVADIPPPGVYQPGSGGGGFNCDISADGLEEVEFSANCFDGSGTGAMLTVDSVLGEGEVLVSGVRVQLTGAFDLASINNGKIEASIGCDSYQKCSYPFKKSADDYVLRLDTSDCGEIVKPQEITLRLFDADTETNHVMCAVTLGEVTGEDDDTGGDEWNCDIPGDDLVALPYSANCFDPFDAGNEIEVTEVLGTQETLVDGARFEVRGAHDLASIASGKFELTIGCPSGAVYPKCSWPFETPQGDFQTRVQVANCDPATPADRITLNVWDEDESRNTTVCEITIGEPADDDDDNDDNNDDNDSTI